jgi:NAD(P)-dependent dehydrogenase (short-subunit alcohol dehydrogenase family)
MPADKGTNVSGHPRRQRYNPVISSSFCVKETKMKVAGKVIVVTGGGSGIGRALVLGLLKRDAKVAAVDIQEKALRETLELAGDKKGQASIHVVDITDRKKVETLPKQVIDAHGAVDGLINNAGIIQPFVKFNDLEYKDIERVVNVNLYGQIHMIKSFLP